MNKIKTLGELKKSGYQPKTIKDELRDNLIKHLDQKKKVFEGIIGYDDTVVPDIERAILSRHNILLLGLRGQAKTRLARLMVQLMDEYIPVVKGAELNDDPMRPISRFAKDLIAGKGDNTEIAWLHRSDRYVEKLATPDVSIADLIGDADPIKAATLKLPYSDERVIHFGLIPRSHRSIFVINELPDLQARIQVGLFNILQEGDMQIRGFKLRLPLDVFFVFTANPEDYTNRGSIITPLKDRIESQILTHYPNTIEDAMSITTQEVTIDKDLTDRIKMAPVLSHILERISFVARDNELIDDKSGVSARLSISGYENLISTAERRMLINKEEKTSVRISDFVGVIPSITGKIELVYEGEQEGAYNVALDLIGEAIKEEFLQYFHDPDKADKRGDVDLFEDVRHWFSSGHELEILNDTSDKEYYAQLEKVPGLKFLAGKFGSDPLDQRVGMELILHALAEFDLLSKELISSRIHFRDILANMLDDLQED